MVIDEVLVFGNKVKTIGKEFDLVNFITYGEGIKESARVFYIEKIEQYVGEFPQMIDALQKRIVFSN
ncbi:MAG: hypothetical protein GY754_47030 [bacterium]|nr:hypothetical protein [bacterium]